KGRLLHSRHQSVGTPYNVLHMLLDDNHSFVSYNQDSYKWSSHLAYIQACNLQTPTKHHSSANPKHPLNRIAHPICVMQTAGLPLSLRIPESHIAVFSSSLVFVVCY